MKGFLWGAAAVVALAGCYPPAPPRVEAPPEPPPPPHDHDSGFHYASTNVIEDCKVGHVMLEITATQARLWFVGPNVEKLSPVPLAEKRVVLQVEDPVAGKPRPLVFTADPVKAGKETVGRCSRFTANAPWLEGQVEIRASGSVRFRGKKRAFRVRFPHGEDLH